MLGDCLSRGPPSAPLGCNKNDVEARDSKPRIIPRAYLADDTYTCKHVRRTQPGGRQPGHTPRRKGRASTGAQVLPATKAQGRHLHLIRVRYASQSAHPEQTLPKTEQRHSSLRQSQSRCPDVGFPTSRQTPRTMLPGRRQVGASSAEAKSDHHGVCGSNDRCAQLAGESREHMKASRQAEQTVPTPYQFPNQQVTVRS